jgi:hypothetical protein
MYKADIMALQEIQVLKREKERDLVCCGCVLCVRERERESIRNDTITGYVYVSMCIYIRVWAGGWVSEWGMGMLMGAFVRSVLWVWV